MTIKVGAYVSHRVKAEWGIGKVEGIAGDNVFIRFPDQLRTIKAEFAERLLDPATADEFKAAKPAARAPRRGSGAPRGGE